MIRIGILGDIGSGKSYIAKNFGYPVFNADFEVSKIYKKDKKIFKNLKKVLPSYIHSFPIDKIEIQNAILANKNNLKKIIKIVHFEIQKKLNLFLKVNNKRRIVILDIPLLLENKINKKDDILVYVDAKKLNILKRLKKRKYFNEKLNRNLKSLQLPLTKKKKLSNFVIKNTFNATKIKNDVKHIKTEILNI